MNVQYLTSVGIRPHPNAIDALIRFSDQVVAPRERDVAGFFSGNMSPAWAECYNTAVQAMQLEFYQDDLKFTEARTSWAQAVQVARTTLQRP